MRRLKPRAFLAGGSALLLLTVGAGTSWGLATQPPSDQAEAEETEDETAGEDETTGEVVEADDIAEEEDTATAPGKGAPQASGGAGAPGATGGGSAPQPASPASAEDPPLGSSGDGGTGGNGRPTQDPDRPGFSSP